MGVHMVVFGSEAELILAYRRAREVGSPVADAMLAIAETCAFSPSNEIVSPSSCVRPRRGDIESPWTRRLTD